VSLKKNKYNVLIVFMLLCDLLLWDMGQVRELFASMSRLIASVFTCRHFEKKNKQKKQIENDFKNVKSCLYTISALYRIIISMLVYCSKRQLI